MQYCIHTEQACPDTLKCIAPAVFASQHFIEMGEFSVANRWKTDFCAWKQP